MSVSSSTINTAAMEKKKKYIQQSGNEYKNQEDTVASTHTVQTECF